MNKYRLSFESVLTFFVLEEVDETCFNSLAFSGQSRKTADLGNLGLKVFHHKILLILPGASNPIRKGQRNRILNYFSK